jgi:hypothetical protein
MELVSNANLHLMTRSKRWSHTSTPPHSGSYLIKNRETLPFQEEYDDDDYDYDYEGRKKEWWTLLQE